MDDRAVLGGGVRSMDLGAERDRAALERLAGVGEPAEHVALDTAAASRSASPSAIWAEAASRCGRTHHTA